MSQEIEIEFKNLLTKKEFHTLLTHYKIKEIDLRSQTNYYFDTEHFALKSHKAALRIRYKHERYTLTLKEPHGEDLLETHQPLTKEEATTMLTNGNCIDGVIKDRLSLLNIGGDALQLLGELTTNRAEIEQGGNLLVFDHSTYLDCEDYELEMEVTNRSAGELAFKRLLAQFNIPIRHTPNKIKRFFERKQLLQEENK